ncbi:MAG: GNAT family N-acetyltransferase [Streptosporangiaceae bacterium]
MVAALTDSPVIRPIRKAEWDAYVSVLEQAFGETESPEEVQLDRELIDLDRTLAAFDGATMCGTTCVFPFEMTVPGGALLPVAGVSAVAVLPTHRRRGVLTGMMRRQLTDLYESGAEPVAALYASEPAIYGRFGYGIATYRARLAVPRDPRALADPPADASVRLRLVVPSDSLDLVAPVYAANVPRRPGLLTRSGLWAKAAILDPERDRKGYSPLRCVLAEDTSGVQGYAWYATTQEGSGGRPGGTVGVREVFAADRPAYAALWRYLLDLDLMGTVEARRPIDDPLLAMLADPRRAAPVASDGLHVRLVDVGRALAARTYATEVDVVFDVTDSFCPWNTGRWRLTGGPEGATCERTSTDADLVLSVRELGAAYLGGTSLHTLAGAGRVNESRRGALAAAAHAFAHAPAPYCATDF